MNPKRKVKAQKSRVESREIRILLFGLKCNGGGEVRGGVKKSGLNDNNYRKIYREKILLHFFFFFIPEITKNLIFKMAYNGRKQRIN